MNAQRGFLLLLLVACREPDPPALPAGTSATATPPTESDTMGTAERARDCAALTRTACMERPDCTLTPGPTKPNYVCRTAQPPCEYGIRQADLEGTDIALSKRTQESCAARPGCVYVPSRCYCHCRGVGQTFVPDGDEAQACECECGGGAPPMCAERESETAPSAEPPQSPASSQCTEPRPGPDWVCVQKCGPPVVHLDDPPPGYGWYPPQRVSGGRVINCPKCLPWDARIATPTGDVRVADVEPGMLVYTLDGRGRRVASKVLRVGSSAVPSSHTLIQVELADGRRVRASPEHPTSDGRRMSDLVVGSELGGVRVVGVEKVPYNGSQTHDLLPAGPTGAYWADGVLLGSTLVP